MFETICCSHQRLTDKLTVFLKRFCDYTSSNNSNGHDEIHAHEYVFVYFVHVLGLNKISHDNTITPFIDVYSNSCYK